MDRCASLVEGISMIPGEAVEAAAKGIWEARPMERVYEEGSPNYGAAKPWEDIKQYQRDRCMTLARFALEAAHPALLAELRKAREALGRVEALAHRWETVPALRKGTAAADLRAAVAAAKETE